MISQTVQESSLKQINTHIHRWTLLKTIPPTLCYCCTGADNWMVFRGGPCGYKKDKFCFLT